jgi:peroxiredoxin Q/BCP
MRRYIGGIAVAVLGITSRLSAQEVPKVGDLAPDFTIPSVTASSAAPVPFHLADYRGQTVVLAFFPKARTKG